LQKGGLRVLIYSDHFFPSVGGSENYALDLATELTKQGLEVGVITTDKAFYKDEFSFQTFRLRRPFSPHRVGLNFLETLGIIKHFQPDIFHINYQTGGENLLIPILKIMKIPFVITYHADHVIILGKMIDELQLISTFRLASMIMVQSERDEKKFKMRGIQMGKLRLIRFNGIDTEKYKCSPKGFFHNETIRLLCIARLDDSHKYKGIYELIEGIKSLRNEKLTLKLSLNVIGDGNLRKPYEEECKAANLNNIKFLGDLCFEDLINQICQANFLILPSIDKAEGFGRVVLEALSCGTPVIVSKYAGIAELISKYDAGIVYDPFKFRNLANNLSSLFARQQNLQKFIDCGKKLIAEEGLSLSDTTRETVKLYFLILGVTNYAL
jgi:glycosyltransferase involved in cell wall biosynthesis